MSEQDGSATIKKYTRKHEQAEAADKDARKQMKAVIAAAMKDDGTRKNIINELREARKGGGRPHTKEGYGEDNEIITGWNEARPWERD